MPATVRHAAATTISRALAQCRTAARRLARLVRNVRTDLRYGGLCAGSVRNEGLAGATDVVNTDYELMPQIFAGEIRPSDVLVDIGCGKGRVINYWLDLGLKNRIVGIELNPDVAAGTARRLKRFENVRVRPGDAIEQLPEEGTLFYMFNPINDPKLVRKLADRMAAIAGDKPDLKLIYYAPVHADVFRSDPRWRVAERELRLNAGPFAERHGRVAVITPASPGSMR